MDYFNFLKNKTLELHVCAVSASLPLPIKLLPCAPAQIYNLYFVIVRHKHTHMHTCVYNLLNLLNVSLMRICLGLASWTVYSRACPGETDPLSQQSWTSYSSHLVPCHVKFLLLVLICQVMLSPGF